MYKQNKYYSYIFIHNKMYDKLGFHTIHAAKQSTVI